MESHDDVLLRRGRRSFLVLMGGWAVPAVMIGLAVYAIQRGSERAEPLAVIFARQLWYYWFFAALCPLLYRLQVRSPFARGSWRGAILTHAGAGAVVVAVMMALSGLAEWALSRGGGAAPLELVVREFTSQQGQFRAIVHLFYFVAAVGAMTIVRLGRRRLREEERAAGLALRASQLETQVTRARLQALETQLNPHFLFNALNGIASLVRQRQSDRAYDAIALLGDLLRATLRAGDRHTIPLAREVELLEKYLDLERMRFSDRLRVSIEVAGDCRGAAVPTMILQPLVENAIRHGISKIPEAGLLLIAIRRQGPRLLIEVRDDGPGPPEGWTLAGGAGVGLGNLRDRLAAHFDAAFELSLDAAPPRGAVARVSLPIRPFREEPT